MDEAGFKVVGISYDTTAKIKTFTAEKNISFPVLSDEASEAIRAFGILNDKAKGRQAGISKPTTFVVDSYQQVLARLDGTVTKRHTAEQLLESVEDD